MYEFIMEQYFRVIVKWKFSVDIRAISVFINIDD